MADNNKQQREGCLACRFLRRKCRPDCVLAPYFPPHPCFYKLKRNLETTDPTSSPSSSTQSDQEKGKRLDHNPSSPVGPGCASCQKNRQECGPECLLAPYFPATRADDLAGVEKVFGVQTLTEVLIMLRPETRPVAVESMVREAKALAERPAAGSLVAAIVHDLVGDLMDSESEIRRVVEQVESCRASQPQFQEDQASTLGITCEIEEESKNDEESPRSPLGRAIFELYDVIEQQEKEVFHSSP